MSYINQIQQIIYEYLNIDAKITDDPNNFVRQGANSHVILTPSQKMMNISHLDVQNFDVYLIALKESLGKSTLESRKNTIYTMRTNSLVGYQCTKRVLFSVTSATGFAEGDTVHNAASAATGVISRISGNTFYLKEVSGIWTNTNTITNDGTGTTTLTTNETIEYYPLSINVELTISGINGYRLTIEGRWEI